MSRQTYSLVNECLSILTSDPGAPAASDDRANAERDLSAFLKEKPSIETVSSNLTSLQTAPGLSGALQDVAKSLHKQQRVDTLSHQLRTRSESAPSSSVHVAPAIAGMATKMDRVIKEQRVNEGLRDRSTSESLVNRGYIYKSSEALASGLQGRAVDLETHLTDRQGVVKETLVDKHILTNPRLADTLQPTGNTVSKLIENRPTATESRVQAVTGDLGISPALQDVARRVDKKMKGDSLKKHLEASQEAAFGDLKKGMVFDSAQMAPSIQSAAVEVQAGLKVRTDKSDLPSNLFPYDRQAPAIQAASQVVDSALKTRPGVDEVVENRASSLLQGAIKMIERKQREDRLSGQLKTRPEATDSSVMDHFQFSPVAMDPSLHPSAFAIESKLKERRDMADLPSSLFPLSHLPPHLRPAAMELESGLQRASAARMTLLKAYRQFDERVAESLHATAKSIDTQRKSLILKAFLENRPSVEEVRDKVAHKQDDAIAGVAKEVEMHVRRKSLTQKLDARPSFGELHESKKIPYAQGVSREIQPSMAMLEKWWKSRVTQSDLIAQGVLDEEDDVRITELGNPSSVNIDVSSPVEIVRILRECDAQIFSGWNGKPSIFDFVSIISLIMRHGQRILKMNRDAKDKKNLIVLSGCGTSGRLAYLVSRVMNGHLGEKEACFEYIIAGGDKALLTSQELPEDDPKMGVDDLIKVTREANQVLLIGITCGLSAPYVGGQIEYAQAHEDKYVCVLMGFNPAHLSRDAVVEKWDGKTFRSVCLKLDAVSPKIDNAQWDCGAILLNPIVGPEPITGSTRMKSGSVTKILLDTIFTCALAANGKGNQVKEDSKESESKCQSAMKDNEVVWNVMTCFEQVTRAVYRYSSMNEMGKAIESAATALNSGGRVIYFGLNEGDFVNLAGFIDASEMKPTFGTRLESYRSVIPNGWGLVHNRSGDLSKGNGDIYQIGANESVVADLKSNDFVLCIGRGGKGAGAESSLMNLLKKCPAQLAVMSVCFGKDKLGQDKDERFVCEIDVCLPDRIVQGIFAESSIEDLLKNELRLFGAKLVLNAVSTGAHVMTGKVAKNKMINVRVANDKLFYRAISLIREFGGGVSFGMARRCLLRAIYGDEDEGTALTRQDAPVSEHIAMASSMDRVVPVAIILAQFSRTSRQMTVKDAQAKLDENPSIRQTLKELN